MIMILKQNYNIRSEFWSISATTLNFKHIFCFIWSDHWFYEVQLWSFKLEIWFDWFIYWFSQLCEWLGLTSLWFYCGFLCFFPFLFFSFLSGHYFVDVVMVLLTTIVKFLFPFAVPLLLKTLVSSHCYHCFQFFCCHVVAVKILLICLCHFPLCPCPYSTTLQEVCCGC